MNTPILLKIIVALEVRIRSKETRDSPQVIVPLGRLASPQSPISRRSSVPQSFPFPLSTTLRLNTHLSVQSPSVFPPWLPYPAQLGFVRTTLKSCPLNSTNRTQGTPHSCLFKSQQCKTIQYQTNQLIQ